MTQALRDIIRNKAISAKANTITGLAKRGLADSTGALTHNGWKQAIVLLPLAEQCHHLGITHEKLSGLNFQQTPELASWQYFASYGYAGGYCEGGPILLLIRSAALNALARLNSFGSRKDACTRFTEAQLTILHEHSELILNAIRSSDTQQVAQHFSEIYSSLMVQECYPGLTPSVIASLFDTLGSERLAQITSAIMEAPYLYRAGWPDLIMTNGSEMLWAEIKTTDRLHMSQITTLYRMKPLLSGNLRVIQLIS
jgi:hypothetical protein